MASNPFDQFDEKPASGSPFDRFDETAVARRPERLNNEEFSRAGSFTPSGERGLEFGDASSIRNIAARLPDVPQYMQDVATGMTGIYRGAGNIASKVVDSISGKRTLSDLISPEQRRGYGDIMFPEARGSKNSGFRTLGEFMDPVALAVGGGVGKVLPYIPVLGKGVIGGSIATARNAGSGAVAGGIIGGLSDHGDAGAGAGAGAILNVALPPVLSGVGKGIGRIVDAWQGKTAINKAGDVLREVAGTDLPVIKAAMAAAPNDLTAAQAAAGVKNDVWSAAGEMAAKNDKTNYFSRLAESQKEAREEPLRRIAGGATQTEAKQAAEQSHKTLNQITGPMFDAELAAANSSAMQGLPPLKSASIIGPLDTMIKDPKIGSETMKEKVLTAVKGRLEKWTDADGVIDAAALHGIRKSAVNDAIEQLMGGADPKSKARAAAGVLKQVKPLIDDAIVKAGGVEWRNVLKTFEEGMRTINQKQLGAKALEFAQESPKKLEALAAGNRPKVVEKIFNTEYDLNKAMGQKAIPIHRAASELGRDRMIVEAASRGEGGLEAILKGHKSSFTFPNWINREVAVTNRMLRMAEENLNKNVAEKVMQGMRSGRDALAILSSVPAAERMSVLKVLTAGRVRQPAVSGGASAMSQVEERDPFTNSRRLSDRQ